MLLILFGLAAGGWFLGSSYLGPFRSAHSETFVELTRGMSSRDIAQALASAGVVRSEWAFLAIRATHPRATLQAGEYRFGPIQSPSEVFEKIRRGDIFFSVITIPEGSNKFDIANLVRSSDTVDPDAFLAAVNDAASVRDLDPTAPSLEGYLFPSTYRVTRKTTGRQLCGLMTAEFRRQLRAIAGTGSGVDLHRVVTLASLIEKETAVPEERPLVAAVFENRLRLNMPLQCDPTIVYAALLANRYRGVIHKSDLESGSPYNTYAHAGLPPGPIANPGRTSLQAAFQPGSSPFLYFVAKPNGAGSHHFSATLAEHTKAVEAFRRGAH